MYSIGRMISNFREFYNDINAATLTGAIDVVVVEQPDGAFTCSPFHVRFGKLGVLRSKEKLVDIEINGEIRDIHMKLGESGEAFFVEGVYEEDETVPENLATSPITVPEFAGLYADGQQLVCPRPRRKSVDVTSEFFDENSLNQPSEYSHRRYTDGGDAEKRRERQLQEQQQQHQQEQYIKDKLEQHEQQMAVNAAHFERNGSGNGRTKHIEIFQMDEDLDITKPMYSTKQELSSPTTPTSMPKTFRAETLADDYLQIGERKVLPQTSDFIPINDGENDKENEKTKVNASKVDSTEEPNFHPEDNNKANSVISGKKRRRKRSLMKKKNSQRKNSNSSSGNSVHSEQEIESSQADSAFFREAKLASEKSMMSQSMTIETCDTQSRIRDPDIHFFSDTEVSSAQSPRGSRPCTPVQSDTEFEMSQRHIQTENNAASSRGESVQHQSWLWGELPSPPPKSVSQQIPLESGKADEAKQAERNSMLSGMFSFMKQTKRLRAQKAPVEGLYLADLSARDLDPNVAAMYFPQAQISSNKENAGTSGSRVFGEEDYESGNGPSLTQSPSSQDSTSAGGKSADSDFDDSRNNDRGPEEILISLCGGLNGQGPSDEEFQNHIVSYNESAIQRLCTDQMRLTHNAIGKSENENENESTKNDSRLSWWYWRRSTDKSQSKTILKEDSSEKTNFTAVEEVIKEQEGQLNANISIDIPGIQDSTVSTQTNVLATGTNKETMITTGSEPKEDGYSGSQSSEESDPDTAQSAQIQINCRPIPEKYRKTLRLSSEQIQRLNLNEGLNEVVFSVTTAYQGTSRCKCYMYRWRYDDKVVISDIDGTITKSDVLGHILPIVGKDWAQSGVAQLFTKIKNNGYKLLYLSSRAIGQAKGTREYLKSIKQNDLSLPDGPLLLNPTSLISAFHREVIEKKPEQFKISCLNDVQALFPIDTKPFYAGYGNRINDVWAYRAVGIPIMRIFTINHRGELKHELTQTFQSSYTGQSGIVNDLFPPVREDQLNSFNNSN
uniref:LNS2/PITP domain-containing protein n=1 Tax=Xenopsylla cheopis TaxID=163159 RepID=A0A6M2DQE0_XENCH